jgi:hypothetical protein
MTTSKQTENHPIIIDRVRVGDAVVSLVPGKICNGITIGTMKTWKYHHPGIRGPMPSFTHNGDEMKDKWIIHRLLTNLTSFHEFVSQLTRLQEDGSGTIHP